MYVSGQQPAEQRNEQSQLQSALLEEEEAEAQQEVASITMGLDPSTVYQALLLMGFSEPLAERASRTRGFASVGDALDWTLALGASEEETEVLSYQPDGSSPLSDDRSEISSTRSYASTLTGAESIERPLNLGVHTVSLPRETFLCLICYCNEPLDKGFMLSNCGHRFCKDCIGGDAGWFTNRIQDGDVRLMCFADSEHEAGGCGAEIASADIEANVSPETFAKFCKFKVIIENPDARSCPRCEHLQIGRLRRPQMTCAECGEVYCFTHGDAHPPGVSCWKYERSIRTTMVQDEAFIKRNVKKCPECGFGISKDGGCNHMTCSRPGCGGHFCWLCGKHFPRGYEDVTGHYAPWNILCGCPMAQENEVLSWLMRHGGFLSMWLYRIAFAVCLVLAVPLALVAAGVTAVLGCASLWFCAPCDCEHPASHRMQLTWAICMGILGVPVLCVVLVTVLPLFVCTHFLDIAVAFVLSWPRC